MRAACRTMGTRGCRLGTRSLDAGLQPGHRGLCSLRTEGCRLRTEGLQAGCMGGRGAAACAQGAAGWVHGRQRGGRARAPSSARRCAPCARCRTPRRSCRPSAPSGLRGGQRKAVLAGGGGGWRWWVEVVGGGGFGGGGLAGSSTRGCGWAPGDPVATSDPEPSRGSAEPHRDGRCAPGEAQGPSSGTAKRAASDRAVLTEDCVIRRDRQVGHHVQDVPAADGVARDHRDDRLRAAAHLHLEVQDLQPWRRLGAVVVAAVATNGLVSAGAEGVRPVAREDDDAHLHVVPRDRERAHQLVHGDRAERVVHLRPADRDLRNPLGRDGVPHILQPQGRGAVVPDHLGIRDRCKAVAIDARWWRRPSRHRRAVRLDKRLPGKFTGVLTSAPCRANIRAHLPHS